MQKCLPCRLMKDCPKAIDQEGCHLLMYAASIVYNLNLNILEVMKMLDLPKLLEENPCLGCLAMDNCMEWQTKQKCMEYNRASYLEILRNVKIQEEHEKCQVKKPESASDVEKECLESTTNSSEGSPVSSAAHKETPKKESPLGAMIEKLKLPEM